ncbi:hypothetical protein BN946_scf184844.g105 [Trametes cinnabarina]|uniref:Nephrocystin 3-like N-terminal domain-containing protein n=1 Tax=Pycnoporus cinnabarinus TaxID=5643 RepID=A0A060SA29_PYCCI|nr:hypothetical protein BN946_scf184844.g105 [Trametes cinnabarina]
MPLCCFTFGSPRPLKRPPQPTRTAKSPSAVEKREEKTPALAPAGVGWKEVKNTAVNGLMIALRVTKEATAVFPPLQSAAGGLLVVAETFQVSDGRTRQRMSSNKEDIEELTEYIAKLNAMITSALPPDYESCPEKLKERLLEFNNRVQSVREDVEKLASQRLPAQLLNADDTAEQIEGCIKSLSWLIQSLTVEGTISIELAVDELHIVIRQGFTHMDGRFDGLSDQIGGVSDQINQLRSDANPGLRYTIQARFDDHRGGRSQCEANTRLEALATVYAWLRPGDHRLAQYPPPLCAVRPENPLFWISGLAGTGKSTLAQTIAHWCEDVGFLGATFFAARDGERSNVQLIFSTVAHQLAALCPEYQDALNEAVRANPDIHGALPSRQLQKFIVEPLRSLKRHDVAFPPCAVIIDALDECKDEEAVSVILKALSLYVSDLAPLKFVITSRPVPHVSTGFRLRELVENTQQFSLSSIPVDITKRDISLFLRSRLAFIKEQYYIGGYWPNDHEIDALVDLASELFIFAATAVKFVGDDQVSDPERQLVLLLQPTGSALNTSMSPYKYLDALYLQVLRAAFPAMDRALRAHLKIILGTIALSQEQLCPGALEALLHLPSGAVRRTLRQLHSIIVVPPTDEEVIRIIHRSFSDFVVDPSRCVESNFRVNPSIQNTVIAKHCLQTLSLLHRDMCGIGNETLLNIEIVDLNSRIEKYISPSLRYACKYWSYHLCHAELDQEILDALVKLCNNSLLYWLEALSLLGAVDMAIEALQGAREALEKLPLPPTNVPSLLYDCERIVRSFYPALSAGCFQAYKSAIPFSPTNTLLRSMYLSQAPGIVKLISGMQTEWSPNITSTEAHKGRVHAVAYSPDGERIVSCSEDWLIMLWDARTGRQLHVLEGHSARVCSVVFSPSGKELLSASDDLTVKVWDATTGACLVTWKRHTRDVRSVAWSSDGVYAASGSYDSKVILWPVASPQTATVFTDHRAEVDQVVFASDGDLLSAGHDCTSKMWSVQSKSCIRTFTHAARVMTVAVSKDSRLVACGCDDTSVVLWNKATGERLHTLNHHASWIWSLDFSPDDRILASGSWDHTMCLWDVATATHLQTLLGHADQVLCVRFSPDGSHIVTGECDHSVRIWECDLTVLDGRKPKKSMLRKGLQSLVKPPEEKRTWYDPTGTYSTTGEHHASGVRVVSFSPNGALIATAAWDGTVRIWDVATGTRVKTLEGHEHLITSCTWSRSGKLLASTGDHDHSINIWNVAAGKSLAKFTQHIGGVWTSIFTPDEQRLVSCSDDGSIRLWHVDNTKQSGAPFSVLYQGKGPIYSLALSADAQWLLSGSLDAEPPDPAAQGAIHTPLREPTRVAGQIRGVWEETYGYPTLRLHDMLGNVLWLENHASTVASVAFSRDSTRALSGSQDGRIFVYDFTHILPLGSTSPPLFPTGPGDVVMRVFEVGDGLPVEHVSFSPGERAIVSDASYTPLDQPLWSAAAHTTSPSTSPVYFLLNGWLWRAVPELRRVCWVPPVFRHFRTGATAWRGNMAMKGHIVAFGTKHGQLVILDASDC